MPEDMSKNKAQDAGGVVAEMLQLGGHRLLEAVAALFTDILKPDSAPQEESRKTRLVVLHKKGDLYDPGNYRPIAMLPILYKAFNKVMRS